MKLIKWGFLVLLTMILISLYLNMGPGSPRNSANKFFTKIEEGHYEEAFDYVYFHDNAYDEDVTITYDEARENWVSRVEQLKAEGNFIKSYSGIEIRSNDGYPQGYVTLTVVENGKERIYEDVAISFVHNKSEDKWQVGNLQSFESNVGEQNAWEKAYRGYVGE
ncbi:hypothetical protein IMZ08_05430 [Bacillus luteolus]|uniref:Uncharacterized protein n=1 Tax=Litchfieldia luteola TaxID=682179 RepID=A0ABR9QG96_9BACI|nr:hypothetical protein [Cytobacillus luteolus]MBE4907504.1 hypothetical protein [Cytobacillus luteolus]MBP1944272.1 hypothetical protein [Cytobacillus luteolus]